MMSNLGIVPEAEHTMEVNIYILDEAFKPLYSCILCKKIFYNQKALQNHKNSQHDIEDFNVVEDQISPQLISLHDEVTDNTLDEAFKPLYSCILCKKTFYNQKALQNHKYSQHDIEDFNVVEDQISPQLISLHDEVTDNTLDEAFKPLYSCILCKKTFYNQKALQNHKNSQHDIEDFNVVEDQISPQLISLEDEYLNRYNYVLSESSNKENNVTVEDELTKLQSSQDALCLVVNAKDKDLDADSVVKESPKAQEKGPVHFSGPFLCTFPPTLHPDMQCGKIFVDCCDFSLHYHEKHTKPRKRIALRCQVCEKHLATKKDRDNSTLLLEAQPHTNKSMNAVENVSKYSECNEHNSKKQVKTKPHQCATCSKRFTQKRGLQLHMRIHAGIRPFACTHCPKTFTIKYGLTQHLQTHTKIKQFECIICKKRFLQSVHLRQHMRTHTKIKPFECVVCKRRFRQIAHLNYHMGTHVTDNSS